MAMRWNWRKLGYGSGALVATLSAVFALSPSRDGEQKKAEAKMCQNDNQMRIGSKPNFTVATEPRIDGNGIHIDRKQMLLDSIEKSRTLCKRVKNEMGLPGLTVAVSVNGKLVWQEGFGYANLENHVKMKPESVIRIASISKSLTMAMLAKLMEEGKIDIDKPIQTYLSNYPQKCVDGEKVTITTRHLLSHMSGIRHYKKKGAETDNVNDPKDTNVQDAKTKEEAAEKPKKKRKNSEDEMSLSEYFLKDKFKSVEESLKLFQDDELFHKPGSKYMYTTHGWTVVSAIIEKLTETEFPKYAKRMFDYWGLKNTHLDLHEPIIYNRASYYTRTKDGIIINSPYVDNSYKWAGGGFLSTVGDLNQFANILLYCMQAPDTNAATTCANGLPKLPYLKKSTIKAMWTGNPVSARPEVPDMLYALGFVVGEPLRKCMFCKERNLMVVHHSGGAIGASSILLLAFPVTKSSESCDDNFKSKSNHSSAEGSDDVKGVVVSMITNLTSIGLTRTANEIANIFRDLI